MYRRFFKRALDILVSLIAIVALLPLYIGIALLVRLNLGNPVLYKQRRIGKNEKYFHLHKFRSMTNATDVNGALLPETERLTPFGKLLRSTSLDELPELFSILSGKMSLVGPRPLPDYYGPYFYDNERIRHSVRGGLIPPDSLSGKTYTSWEEQFSFEIDYAKNLSFSKDVKIIWMTFRILFNRMESDYGADFDRPHLNIYRSAKYTHDQQS